MKRKSKSAKRGRGIISSFIKKIQRALAEQNITMQVDVKGGRVDKVTLLNHSVIQKPVRRVVTYVKEREPTTADE